MGYYYNDKYSSILDFNNSEDKDYLYQKGIILINNENTVFDFSNYTQNREMNAIIKENIPNRNVFTEKETNLLVENSGLAIKDCLFKIIIDYKDGTIESLNKPDNNSTDWLKTTHKFSFTGDEYYNLSSDVSTWPTIDISLYNLYGFKDEISIPFKLKKASFNQSNTKLNLISANIRNDNKIAYTFLDENTNQIILTTSNFNSFNSI
jgi:hypothetical protein